jgi:UDP-N-acetylglucosamine--N-acetylmuramyl-(pentapeptide) pyrophosphoryl-undecaprenol N-acetylglucosamine transferase
VAYEGMEKYFPASRIAVTGNPVRSNITEFSGDRIQAIKSFGLDPSKKTVLVVGGSLGARTLNECMVEALSKFESAGVQVIWQSGKRYYEEMSLKLKESGVGVVALVEFISSMDEAYAAADLVVSRAGAIAISELCVVGKPVILVPSPNVADDHQTKNALALVNRSAAVFISDREASEKLADVMLSLVNDENKKNEISSNIRLLGRPHATEDIVSEIEKLIKPVAA